MQWNTQEWGIHYTRGIVILRVRVFLTNQWHNKSYNVMWHTGMRHPSHSRDGDFKGARLLDKLGFGLLVVDRKRQRERQRFKRWRQQRQRLYARTSQWRKKGNKQTVEMDGERERKTGWERERGREREEGECEWRRGGQECGRNSHK